MQQGISQLLDAQKISERLETDQIAGAGAPPTYIVAEEIQAPEIEPSLSVDISGIRASLSSSQASRLTSSAPENLKEDSSNYILNQPLRELLSKVKSYFESELDLPASETKISKTGETYGTVSSALTAETLGASTANESASDDYDHSATYTVEAYENYDTGEVTITVTDPDGEKHTFDNWEEAQAYLAAESQKYDGYVIVDVTTTKESGDWTSETSKASIYKNGEVVVSFTPTTDEGVVILSAHEKAEQWLQNQHYQNADTSYIYEYSAFEGLDENSSDAELAAALDKEMNRTMDNYDERDFYYYDENGNMILDTQRLQDWYEKVRLLAALLIALQMLMKAKHEMRNLVQQEMLGVVTDQGMDTATIIGKYVQNRLARVSVAFAKLLQEAQEWNNELYKRRVEAAERKNDGSGEKTWDFISGGENTINQLESMKDAADKYLAATATNLSIMRNAGEGQREFELGDSDTGKINEAIQKEEMAILAELPSIAFTGENGYLELDSDRLSSVRKRFFSLQNLKKAWNAINSSGSEARNLVHEEMTGVGGRERSQNDDRLQEAESAYTTQLFETQVNLTQQKIQLHNNIRYLENQIEKARASQIWNIFANIFMVAAMVLSFFFPPVGLLVGVVAGLTRLGGAIHAYYLSQNYKPNFSEHKPVERDTNTGNATLDTINQTANLEDEILAKVDERHLEETEDGFKQVNFKAIADLQKQLTRLQNIRRALLALHKERASLRKLVHLEMTGIGGRETSSYVSAVNEADFQQTQFKFEMLAFMLNEVKTANNIEIANEKQLDMAINTFITTLVIQLMTAGIGAAIGGVAEGVAEGASEGAAQGGNAAAQGTAAAVGASEGAAEGASEVAAQGGNAAAQGTAAAVSTAKEGFYIGWGVGSALGGFLSAILNQLVIGSYGVSYGDENLPPYLLALRKNNPNSTEARLDKVEAEIYEDLLANGINRDVGDGYWGLNGDYLAKLRVQLGRIANVRDAWAMLQTAGADARNLVHMEMTGISGRRAGELVREVNQTEAEASLKTFDYLTQYLGQRIEVRRRAVDAGKALTDATWKLGLDLVLIGAAIVIGTPMSIALMTPIMMLVNSAYDFIANLIRANSGMGKLENYDSVRVARELKNQNDPNSTMNKLDQMEMEVYTEISQDLIEQVGGGRWGISTGTAALLRYKMERIFNVRDALARLQAAEAEARAALHAILAGGGGRMSEAGTAFTVDRAVALANVGMLLRNIQTMVERHNQMNVAQRASWQALVGAAFAILNLWLAVESLKLNLEEKQLSKNFEEGKKKLDTLQESYRILQKGGTVEGQTAETLRGKISQLENNLKRIKEKGTELSEIGEKWALYQFVAELSEVMAVWLTGVIYDSTSGGRESKEKEYQSQVSSVSSNEKGWGASVARSEAGTVQSALSAGDTELDTEALEIGSQQNDELLNGVWGMTTGTVNYVKGLRRPNPFRIWLERSKDKEATTAIPIPVSPSAGGAQTPAKPSEAKNLPPNTKVLLDRLNQLIQQAEEVSEALVKSEGISQKINNVAGEEIKDLKELLAQAREQLEQAKSKFNQAVQDYNRVREEAKELKGKTTAELQNIDAEIEKLSQALSQTKDPKTAKEIQTQIELLKAAKKALESKAAEAEAKVKEAKTHLDQARAEVKEASQTVNRLLAEMEREAKAPSKSRETVTEGAIKQVDHNPNEGRRRRNPYEEYLRAKKEEEAALAQAREIQSTLAVAA